MSEINENLRQELLTMQAEDLRVRTQLANSGELFEGYNLRMEAVHLRNVARLEELLNQHNKNWFGRSLVGEDGAEAAWLIVQHAISRPDVQRKILPILENEATRAEVPLWQAAFLEDRINFFEGKPQRFGSQFDWDERDAMSPNEIFEPEKIDARRAAVGLSVLYSEYIKDHNKTLRSGTDSLPQDHTKRQKEYLEWAQKVGWRE